MCSWRSGLLDPCTNTVLVQYGCAAQEKDIPVWAGPLDCNRTILQASHPPGVTFQLCGSHKQAAKLCPRDGHSVASRSPLRLSPEEVFPPKAPKLDFTNPCSLCHGSEERSRKTRMMWKHIQTHKTAFFLFSIGGNLP